MPDDPFDGHADVVDPRERYDDLIVDHRIEGLDTVAFEKTTEMEAFRAGWVVAGVVLDSVDRVLLAYHEGDAAWLLPGGSLQPGESLADGLVREVREETGVDVEPVRPRAVVEHVVRHGERRDGFRLAVVEARPERTGTATDLGVDGEPISDADWFAVLPDAVYERELAASVLERVRGR